MASEKFRRTLTRTNFKPSHFISPCAAPESGYLKKNLAITNYLCELMRPIANDLQPRRVAALLLACIIDVPYPREDKPLSALDMI